MNDRPLCWPVPWRHRCTASCGKSILQDITVTFLYISPKPPFRSWTWLYHQKGNKTTFPTISCPYGSIVNFSYTSRIHFSANNTSFRPFKSMGLSAHRHTNRHTDTQSENSISLADIKISYATVNVARSSLVVLFSTVNERVGSFCLTWSACICQTWPSGTLPRICDLSPQLVPRQTQPDGQQSTWLLAVCCLLWEHPSNRLSIHLVSCPSVKMNKYLIITQNM